MWSIEGLTPQGLPLEDALLARREITDTGCWMWTGFIQGGYGRFKREDFGTHLVHRQAFMLWREQIPSSVPIHHKCGNSPCFNPDHLQVASQADNTLEMLGRRAFAGRIQALESALAEVDPDHPLLLERIDQYA